MKKHIGVIICGLFLASCATQKPQMTDAQYEMFAKGWAVLHHCNANGYIDPAATARGRIYAASTMNRYSFDGALMDSKAYDQINYGTQPSQQECRSLAASIEGRRQQIENQNATAEIQQREAQNMINATKPTNTYCNKIGTQVLCNSF